MPQLEAAIPRAIDLTVAMDQTVTIQRVRKRRGTHTSSSPVILVILVVLLLPA